MSPSTGLSTTVCTCSTSLRPLMRPVTRCLPSTVNETSVAPPARRVVALLAAAALTNPCGVDHSSSLRSATTASDAGPGVGGFGGGGAPGGGCGTFQP